MCASCQQMAAARVLYLIPCDSGSTNCTASQSFMPLVTNICRRDNLQFQVIVPKGVHLLQNAHHVSDSCTELQYKPACRECLDVPSVVQALEEWVLGSKRNNTTLLGPKSRPSPCLRQHPFHRFAAPRDPSRRPHLLPEVDRPPQEWGATQTPPAGAASTRSAETRRPARAQRSGRPGEAAP